MIDLNERKHAEKQGFLSGWSAPGCRIDDLSGRACSPLHDRGKLADFAALCAPSTPPTAGR